VQFFVEASVVAGLAGAAGLLLAWWAVPMASVLLQHPFDAPVLSPVMVALTALLCLFIAALSALPLALIALRVRPAESLAGRNHSEGAASRRWLRRLMTTLQFAAAAVFASLALTVLWQAGHAGAIPRGFEVQDRVAADLPWEVQPAQTMALLAEIRRWPEVIAVAAADDVPGRDFSSWFSEFGRAGAPTVNLRTGVDFTPGYLQAWGMRVIAGGRPRRGLGGERRGEGEVDDGDGDAGWSEGDGGVGVGVAEDVRDGGDAGLDEAADAGACLVEGLDEGGAVRCRRGGGGGRHGRRLAGLMTNWIAFVWIETDNRTELRERKKSRENCIYTRNIWMVAAAVVLVVMMKLLGGMGLRASGIVVGKMERSLPQVLRAYACDPCGCYFQRGVHERGGGRLLARRRVTGGGRRVGPR